MNGTPPTGFPPGIRHLALGDVGSTNAEALEHARSGASGQLWISAERQLQGRGRRGRNWVSEPGNLYASLLLIDPAPLPKLATLPLVAAIAVYDALKPFFSRTPQALAIKWPNDILVDGAKINGILLESETLADGRIAVVIGCGINCAHHPADTPYPATDLAACGKHIVAQELMPLLAHSFHEAIHVWDRGRNFSAIRERWLRAAYGLGGPIRINLTDRVLEGRFADLDEQGYLLLETASGQIRAISAGDLFFRN